MSDPTRLTDDDELSLIESLRADAPSSDEAATMWKQIAAHAVVASVATAASASSAGATATLAPAKVGLAAKVAAVVVPKTVIAKVGVVLAVGAIGAGAAWMQHVSERAKLPIQAPLAVPRVRTQASAPVPNASDTCRDASKVAPGCVVTAEAPEAPTLAVAAVEKPARSKPRTAKAVPPAISALQAESRLLATARARLRSGDLAGAEESLNEARGTFGEGALSQEREVLQIELLSALGDRSGADHRARRFLRKHPDSPHAKSVQRFLLAP